MNGGSFGRRCGGVFAAGLLSVAALAIALPAPAGADTDPTSLVGEGGSFLAPVTDALLKADSGLAPLNPQYTDANVDNAIGDFVGTAPGTFGADFVVSERPLSSAEAAAANTDGRSFAYVPFAATPVAIATLALCDPSGVSENSTAPLCKNIPLTPTQVGELFMANLTSSAVSPNQGLPTSLTGWSDSRLTQANGQPIPASSLYQASTLEPSAENSALMALLDSDPTAKELFDNALNNPSNSATTASDAPSETWPLHGVHAFVGGDAGLIGKELNLNAETNAPEEVGTWNLGDVFPLSSVWAGAPLGTPWNIATATIHTAAGKFVAPSESAAAASEGDATMDPTTNLVTFNANANDAAAYNNYLMVESYLVVPTTGISADKAQKLAQYIRFITGPVAESEEEVLGSAPPTSTMVAADLKVASELDGEAETWLPLHPLPRPLPRAGARRPRRLRRLRPRLRRPRVSRWHPPGEPETPGVALGLPRRGRRTSFRRSSWGVLWWGWALSGDGGRGTASRGQVVTTTEQHSSAAMVTAQSAPGQPAGHLPSDLDATNVSAWFGSNKVLERISLDHGAGQGHCADRAVRLREVDVPAHLEPDARARTHRSPCGIDHARWCGHLRSGTAGDRDPAEDRHGVPTAEPVPFDDHRAERPGRAQALGHQGGQSRCPGPGVPRASRAVAGGQGSPQRGRCRTVGRTTATPVHCPGTGRPAQGAPHGRALLGPRPRSRRVSSRRRSGSSATS